MKRFLLPLVIGGLCTNDPCFCMGKLESYSFAPCTKTSFFPVAKLNKKISRDVRKWAKKALIASAVIGGGVIAYRFAPVIKSQIKTLGIRLGIIKPPVVKSRREKLGDCVKQHAALPVFFSISGLLTLTLAASSFSKAYDSNKNANIKYIDVEESDSETSSADPQPFDNHAEENSSNPSNESETSLFNLRNFSDKDDLSEITLINSENSSTASDSDEWTTDDDSDGTVYNLNYALNHINGLYQSMISRTIEKDREPSKLISYLVVNMYLISVAIDKVKGYDQLQSKLRQLFRILEQAKDYYLSKDFDKLKEVTPAFVKSRQEIDNILKTEQLLY